MLTPEQLARIAVIGTSCAGKSTLARKLAVQLNAPHIELDAEYWRAGWTPAETVEFRNAVDGRTSAERWVCDGNYSIVRDLVWRRATAIVWLNYSFPRVLGRALNRTFRRCLFREPLYAGNRETFRKSFLSSDSIILWMIKTHGRQREEYPRQFGLPEHAHLKIVELRSDADTQRFIAAVSADVSSGSE